MNTPVEIRLNKNVFLKSVTPITFTFFKVATTVFKCTYYGACLVFGLNLSRGLLILNFSFCPFQI